MTKKSNFAKGFMRKLAKLGRDKSGQIALTFGLAAVPIVGVVGLGVDYTRKIEAQATTQAALDGAAMAATAAFNAGEPKSVYEKAAQDFFDANKPDNLIGSPSVDVKIDFQAATLTTRTNASISTTMAKILGFDSMALTNDHANTGGGSGEQGEGDEGANAGDNGGNFGATVSLPAFTVEHRGEIAMVMDYSGSMGWYLGGERKYKTMRNEAAKLVSALSQAKTNQYVKFAVVPFSSEVYTTMPKKYWYGYKGNADRSSCTRDRNYPYNLTDATPLSPNNKTHASRFGVVKKHRQWLWGRYRWLPNNNPNSYYFYQGYDNYRNNCSSYSGGRNLKIQDLTGNHNDTYNKILSMSPYASTHIAVGMEFGYHVLSPNAPFTNGVPYGSNNTEKAIVLLTDGAQTTKAFGPSGSYSVSNGRSNLTTLCTNIKNDGIRIITISYDLYDTATENRLRNCASSSDDFYDANTKPELVASFNNITAKLARDMYLAK